MRGRGRSAWNKQARSPSRGSTARRCGRCRSAHLRRLGGEAARRAAWVSLRAGPRPVSALC
eukprot:scaffold18995_cov45-Isochrysis_galbana.AAC.1